MTNKIHSPNFKRRNDRRIWEYIDFLPGQAQGRLLDDSVERGGIPFYETRSRFALQRRAGIGMTIT